MGGHDVPSHRLVAAFKSTAALTKGLTVSEGGLQPFLINDYSFAPGPHSMP
jgi:hypothetical protein